MARAGRVLGSILVLVLLLSESNGQDSEDQPAASVNDGGESGVTALERGMKPFYDMTRTFLDLVLRGDLTQRSPGPAYLNYVLNSSESSADFSVYLQDNWQSILAAHAGYAACLIVGILFIIFMPIVGLCFCCCRLCGNCGGKVKPREGRHHKCRQYTCGTILFVCNTIMLIGLVFAFMTNEQLRIRTSAQDDGVVSRALYRVQSFNNYLQNINTDLEAANETFGENVNDFINQILTIGDAAAKKVDEETKAQTLLQQAKELADGLAEIDHLLDYVDGNKTVIISELSNLSNSLSSWKDDAKSSLQSCVTDLCTNLYQQVDDININVDYNQNGLQAQRVTSQDIKDIINTSMASYRKVFDDINDEVASRTQDIEEARVDILKVVSDTIMGITKNITQLRGSVKNATKDIEKFRADIETNGTYQWYGGIGLCCILLLIVLCYFLGLIFGACGDPPYDDSGACNKGVGANLLLAGVGFCFLFGWLLMLICTPMYAVGQIFHTDLCRPLLPNISQSTTVKLLDEVLPTVIDPGSKFADIVPSMIIRNCEKNKGAFEALQLDKYYDINSINFSDIDLDMLDNLNGFDFANVVIFDDNTREQLEQVVDAGLDSLPPNYIAELNKPTLTKDLDDIKTELERQRQVFIDGGKANEAQTLSERIQELETLQSELEAVRGKLANLRIAVEGLQRKMDSVSGGTLRQKAVDLITGLEAAQNIINNQGATLLQDILTDTIASLKTDTVNIADDFKTDIKENVGRCGPAYESLQGLVNIVCVDFLNPFNGFWFSFGWCLAFFIPAIISAVHLAGSYRKTEDYDPNDNKSFDEPNFDAYSGGIYPGDNIPLEERRKYRLIH